MSASRASPPARCRPRRALAWHDVRHWSLTGSWGVAYRMPTVTELYQAITTGTTLTVPNPNLKPERANSYELAAERHTDNGLVRLSLVRGRHHQCAAVAIRAAGAGLDHACSALCRMWTAPGARGLELVADQYDVFIPGLELMGSLTAVDGRTVQDNAFRRGGGQVHPQLPKLRANAVATYRLDDTGPSPWARAIATAASAPSTIPIPSPRPIRALPAISWWMRACATSWTRTGTCRWASTISTTTNISCSIPSRSAPS